MSRVTAIGLMSGTSLRRGRCRADRDRRRGDQCSRPDRLPRPTATASATCCGARSRPRPISATAPSGRDPRRGRRARDRHACRGGGSVPGRERDGGERGRRGRLPRPDRPAPARPRLTGPDRRRARRWRRGSAFPWSTTSAPPMSPPAGRARRWCRSSIARWSAQLERALRSRVLNLGGVANVTFIDGDAELIAFDTGPGNALIDDFVRLRDRRSRCDDDGRAAAAGRSTRPRSRALLTHPFFARPPPKSLDRNAFRALGVGQDGSPRKAPRTAPATLTALTAASVAHATSAAARAGELDRRRRRRAQSDPDADAGAAAARRSASRRPARSAGRPMRWRRRPSPISPCARSRVCRSPFPTTTGVPRPLTDAVRRLGSPRA